MVQGCDEEISGEEDVSEPAGPSISMGPLLGSDQGGSVQPEGAPTSWVLPSLPHLHQDSLLEADGFLLGPACSGPALPEKGEALPSSQQDITIPVLEDIGPRGSPALNLDSDLEIDPPLPPELQWKEKHRLQQVVTRQSLHLQKNVSRAGPGSP